MKINSLIRLKMKAAVLLLLCITMQQTLCAQPSGSPPVSFMESNGKIYVVVAVVVTIVLGLLIYLITLDRKVSRIEKENRTNRIS